MTDTMTDTSTQFSAREVPWMKLGRLVDEPVTAAEAAYLGGLDFTVEKRPMWFGDSNDVQVSKPTRRSKKVAVVRTDTLAELGVMSAGYPVVQFRDAFSFMDEVNSRYVAAGTLKGGKQGFMVVQAPKSFKLLDDVDPHELYVVLRTSHDGSRAVEVMAMPLRGRCMNQLTLNSFASGVASRWSIVHSGDVHVKLQQAKTSLQKVGLYAERYAELAGKMIKIKLTQSQGETILKHVLPDRPKRDETVQRVTDLWHSSDAVGFDWTGWGLLQAVSEYHDWARAGGSPESRFIGALQGSTYKMINRTAATLLTRYAE